jgi:hypothetical protein
MSLLGLLRDWALRHGPSGDSWFALNTRKMKVECTSIKGSLFSCRGSTEGWSEKSAPVAREEEQINSGATLRRGRFFESQTAYRAPAPWLCSIFHRSRYVDRQNDIYLIRFAANSLRIVDQGGGPVIPLRRFAGRHCQADRQEYSRSGEAGGQAADRRCAPAGIKVGRNRTVS